MTSEFGKELSPKNFGTTRDDLNIDKEQRIILQKLRNNMPDLLEPRHDDRFLLRWLRARDYDLQQTEKMLREDFRCRKKMRSDTILEDYEIPKEIAPFIPTTFLGFSKKGHAVRLINIGHIDAKGLVRSLTLHDVTKLTIHSFESDVRALQENNKKTGGNVETSIFIVDYSKLRVHRWCDGPVIRYGIYISKFFQDHYPETLHCLYAINAPKFMLYTFNNILKPFLADNVIKKIRIYGPGDDSYKEDLFSIVPREIVPAYYGGDRYEPEGDPMCHGLLNWRDRVPTSLYKSEELTLDLNDSLVQQKLVHERSTFDIVQDVSVPGAILSWQFQTKDRNIKFGLFFSCKSLHGKRPRIDEQLETLLPLESTESHILVEEGEYVCTKRGKYILHFDNTYSWIRSKLLFYKVVVQNPVCDEE